MTRAVAYGPQNQGQESKKTSHSGITLERAEGSTLC